VETVDVKAWVLPIFAVNHKGAPVLNLQKQDLNLFVNNEMIKSFNFFKRTFFTGQEKVPGGPVPIPSKRKMIVLLFDVALTRPESILRSKAIAEKIVSSSEKESRFIIMTIEALKGLTYIAGPLSDKSKISSLLKKRVNARANRRYALLNVQNTGTDTIHPQFEEADLNFIYSGRTKIIKQKAVSFAQSFESLYYSVNSIKGIKFIYLFSEGIPPSAGLDGDQYGFMARNLLKCGALLFIINPSGGRGSDPLSGELFLKSLAKWSGGKYLYGDSQKISKVIKNVHSAYYEIAFQEPENFTGRILQIEIKSIKKNLNIHTMKTMEKRKSYEEMEDIEKKVMVLNLISKNPLFDINLSYLDAKVKEVVNKIGNQITYRVILPSEFKNTQADLYKINIIGNRDEPVIERSMVFPESNELQIHFNRKEGINHYFALVNREAKLALVKGIPMPVIKILNVLFKDKKLNFKMVEYSQKKIEKTDVGFLRVSIKIKNNEGELVFDDSKQIQAESTITSISIPFNQLTKGAYSIVINAVDLFTGRQATTTQLVNVST
jgi:hypothetical protein